MGGIQHSTELYHHGVKGMKWGVSRYGKNTTSGSTKSDKAPITKDRKYAKKDQLVDRGRVLHQKGETIGNVRMRNITSQVGISIGSKIAKRVLSSCGDSKASRVAIGVVSIGTTTARAVMAAKSRKDVKSLKAYHDREQ